MNSSIDINTAKPIRERTMAIAFRTGDDVTKPQVIYEQGGGVRGMNIYIKDGSTNLTQIGKNINVDRRI